MNVAICQVDGKWPNLALAKLVTLQRQQGNQVEWFNPLGGAEVVYAGKVFTDTADNAYLPPDAIRGGSGYDVGVTLPSETERLRPDWSLWPWWPHDMGYSTRGCTRKCPFCVVPEKEGKLRVVAEFGDLTTGRPMMILLDNNVTAAPIEHFRKFCADATAAGVTIDFRQGLDARLLTDEHAAIIARSKFARRIHLAWDLPVDEYYVEGAIRRLLAAGISPSRLTFYVLVGFNTTPEQDRHRVYLLREWGCDPFVMPFDRTDRYQRRFARWVNNKVAFKSMTWPEFQAFRG